MSSILISTEQQAWFEQALLTWFAQHGRHNLPWQHPRTHYRVWLSEVMLQQTQVQTVIPYFERFIEHFPTLKALAQASQDDVLALWSGLGYYARARNLHRCAQQLHNEHQGRWPDDRLTLETLPGIGRSTASAILAQVNDQPEAICDGNVKRVLARFFKIEGHASQSSTQKQLWAYAEALTPQQSPRDYTQGIMDLGATCCARRTPQCQQCPLQTQCQAFQTNTVEHYPTPKSKVIKKQPKPTQQWCFILLQNQNGDVRLYKRPDKGIWGGLWSLAHPSSAEEWLAPLRGKPNHWPAKRHELTHFTMAYQPIHLIVDQAQIQDEGQWFSLEEALKKGLPTPVRQTLTQLNPP